MGSIRVEAGLGCDLGSPKSAPAFKFYFSKHSSQSSGDLPSPRIRRGEKFK